ncbi:MAG: HD-GYP domain-containing protein [Gemmatimonadota bacterium]
MTVETPPAGTAAEMDERSRSDAGHFLRTLAGLRSACLLYPRDHPAIEAQVEDVHRHASALLDDRRLVRLDIIRGILNCDGQPLQHETRLHARVLREFSAIGIDSVHMADGLDRREIKAVGQFLAHEHRGPGTGEPVVDVLGERGVRNLSFGRIVPVNHRLHERLPEAPEKLYDPDYEQTTELVRSTFDTLEQGFLPDVAGIRDILEMLVGRVARSSVALSQVMALKEYENRSYLHSVNVALLAVRLGERLGMAGQELMALAEAALLHDVGKTRVPVEILTKPGRPTNREWRAIRRHPQIGAEILAELDGLSPLTPVVALEHHVDFVGDAGYPELEPGRRPHPLSQVVSVVDVYESVTGARSYREPATPDRACLILARMAGEKLNPALVKAFVSVVTFFPIGTVVRTTGDEIGVVVETHADDALHPRIVLVDPDRPDADVGPSIDLRERSDGGGFRRDVARSLPARRLGLDVPAILRRAGAVS